MNLINKSRFFHILLVCSLGGLLFVQAYADSSVLYESEPNNTPFEANNFSGSTTIMGAMQGGDQDGYMWSVSDVDAQHSWSFELAGIADALTQVEIIRITFTDDGKEVASKESLFKFGSRDGSRPVQANDLIFEPGDILSLWCVQVVGRRNRVYYKRLISLKWVQRVKKV